MQKNNRIYSIYKLKFSYSDKVILDIDNLEIIQGKITSFLGQNGSGKTTLLKLLNGLLTDYSGNIKFKGEDIRKCMKKIRLSTVYLHQNPFLFSTSVFENIAFGLKIRNYSKKAIRKSVEEILEFVGLTEKQKFMANDLSGGEMQRVAIGRALVIRPDVLLLDEPTSSVDFKNINRIENMLKHIKEKQSTTVIFSSHNERFVGNISENNFVIHNTKIQSISS